VFGAETDLDGIPVDLLIEVIKPVSKNSGKVSWITYKARPTKRKVRISECHSISG